MRLLPFASMLLLVTTVVAKADDIPVCPTPKRVALIERLSRSPAPIRNALAGDVGTLAEPGEEFNATDAVDERLPFNRLIFTWRDGDLWIVAAEEGGSIAYSDAVLVYSWSEGDAQPKLLEQKQAWPNSVCAVAKTLLNAHRQDRQPTPQ